MSHTTVAVLVGSLRSDSLNRKVAEKLRDQAPADVTVTIVEGLESLPFYNEDIDAGTAPEAATHVRAQVESADRVLMVTPEYNGTMPAVLNNAIDWLSRPYGQGALAAKPVAVIGTTPTPYGGKWAHEDTVRSAGIAGAVVLADATVSQPGIDVDVLGDPAIFGTIESAFNQLITHEPVAAQA